VAQRIIRNCLLTPANAELMNALERFASVVEGSFRAAGPGLDRAAAAYQSYAMALMAYRRGDFDAAVDWSRRAKLENTGFQTRDLSVQLIQAMAHAQSGQTLEAEAELQACRAAIVKTSTDTTQTGRWQGFWFDKVSVQIHLREAADLIENSPREAN
jgi:hypothetical protein